MEQENSSKYSITDIVTIISSVIALLCVIFRGKFSLLKEDKKCENKMKEAQFKHDLQKDMLKYRANMNNKSKADSAEQVNEEHEWEDLSEVVNVPDACMPGFEGALPVNSVTALIGAPVVASVLFNKRKGEINE